MTESKQRIRCACPCGCQGYADLPEDLCHYCLECHEDLRKDFVTAKHFCGSKPVSAEDLRKALDKLSNEDEEFFDSVFGKLKGNTVTEREKEVKMRLYKLQGWLIQNRKDVLAVKTLFSVFLADYEKLLKDLAEYNLLCELQASMISGLETFKKQCNGKVTGSRKQLDDLFEAT